MAEAKFVSMDRVPGEPRRFWFVGGPLHGSTPEVPDLDEYIYTDNDGKNWPYDKNLISQADLRGRKEWVFILRGSAVGPGVAHNVLEAIRGNYSWQHILSDL